MEPESWGFLLEDYAAIAAYYLGSFQRAYYHAVNACKLEPEDLRLANNEKLIWEKLQERGR